MPAEIITLELIALKLIYVIVRAPAEIGAEIITLELIALKHRIRPNLKSAREAEIITLELIALKRDVHGEPVRVLQGQRS